MQTEFRTDGDRRRAVERWRRSGSPAREFAPLLGVSSATLYSWSRRFSADPGVAGDAREVGGAARLIELVPACDASARVDPGASGAVEVALTLRCGRTLRFPSHLDGCALRRLVAAAECA